MKIVIEISEVAYRTILSWENPKGIRYALYNAVKNSTPLKTGHWIYSHNNLFGMNIFKCSKCDWDGDAADYNYCPNCGAKMESEG